MGGKADGRKRRKKRRKTPRQCGNENGTEQEEQQGGRKEREGEEGACGRGSQGRREGAGNGFCHLPCV